MAISHIVCSMRNGPLMPSIMASLRNTSGQYYEISLIVPPSDPRMADNFAPMIQSLVWLDKFRASFRSAMRDNTVEYRNQCAWYWHPSRKRAGAMRCKGSQPAVVPQDRPLNRDDAPISFTGRKASYEAPHRPQVSQLVMFPAKCHSVSLSSSMGSISRFAFMKTVSYGWTLVPR